MLSWRCCNKMLQDSAACTPGPPARAPATNPRRLNCARRHTHANLILFAGVWRGRQPVLCLEHCARTHAMWTAVIAPALQGDCVSVVKGLSARLNQDVPCLLRTRFFDHMTHKQKCEHTICRKTNRLGCFVSALSAADVPHAPAVATTSTRFCGPRAWAECSQQRQLF